MYIYLQYIAYINTTLKVLTKKRIKMILIKINLKEPSSG